MPIDNSANVWGKSNSIWIDDLDRLYTCAACGTQTRNPFVAKRSPGHYFCCDSCALRGPEIARKDLEKLIGKAPKRVNEGEAYRWPPPDYDKYSPERDGPIDRSKRDKLVERVREKLDRALSELEQTKPKKSPKKKKPEPKAENPLAARIGQLDFDED